MKCSICGKPIPEGSDVCSFCHMPDDTELTAEDLAIAEQLFKEMTPEMLDELQTAFQQSNSAEEFANRVLVGPCPKCGSEKTWHCGEDPEIDDISVGRCQQCGHLWCTLCDKPLDKSSPICEACDQEWEELDEEWDDEEE
jgi:hypothetical protein